ncbi:MAG: reverse transcriptase domain-containing protein [Gammaproteobacteria bacterium]
MSSSILRLSQVYDWANLNEAARNAACAKRFRIEVSSFEAFWADRLLDLQDELRSGTYRPGSYKHFYIHEPKRRKISAAPFRDRVVHHALCRILEPWNEARFIADSYANRRGKGTHRAIDRVQTLARRFRFVLRLDIMKYFPSIDHEILLDEIAKTPVDQGVLDLCAKIVASGRENSGFSGRLNWFPGDDLVDLLRPTGLPIGNLTSQFWSNVYLNPLDHFIKRELGCSGYVRYVDDMALFGNTKREIWGFKGRLIERLGRLRLKFHESSAQVMPVTSGIPWLGFVVYPAHRLLKSRMARKGRRRLHDVWREYSEGRLSFAELDTAVQAWINHVRYGDTWGLRRHIFASMCRSNQKRAITTGDPCTSGIPER